MAVQRNSEPNYGIGTKDTRQVAQPSIAQGTPRDFRTVEFGDSSWKSKLLGDLVGLTTRVASQAIDSQTADAYLKGAAQAGVVESEAALENQSLTRDWEVAGYRDTMGKVAMAKADAKLASDMSWLRERSPAEFENYIGSMRAELTPQLEGMSERARMSMLPQMALNDQAAIQKHNSEHAAFVFERIQQGYSLEFSGEMLKLDDRKQANDPTGYMGASKTFAAALWRLNDDPRLSPEQKAGITEQTLGLLLSGQHIGVYDELRNTVMPDGFDKDTASSIVSRLPMETQEKLGKAYRTASEATAGMAFADLRDQITIEEASIKAGTSTLTWDQGVALMDKYERAMGANPGKRDSFLNSILENAHKSNDKLGVATAFFGNDKGALLRHGKTDSEAGDIALDVIKDAPPPEQFKQLTQAGTLGMTQAYALAGKVANNSIAALATPDGKMHPQHVQMWGQITDLLDRADADGTPQVADGLLSGLTQENRTRVLRMREIQSTRGLTGEPALALVLQAEAEEKKLTPQLKAAMYEHTAKEDAKFLLGIGDAGWLKRAWWSVTGDVRADMEQNPLFSSAPTEQVRGEFLKRYKDAVVDSMQSQDLAGTNLSQDSRLSAAIADVQSRSMATKHGPVIVPKGQTIKSYFGVANGVSDGTVQGALERVLTPTADGGKFIITPLQGRMVYQEVDRNGTAIPGRAGSMDPKLVASAVRDIMGERKQKMADLIGPGIQVEQNGVKFRYNGENSAGAREQDMLEFRQSLIKHEGVRNTPYDDKTGKPLAPGEVATGTETVGVGISKKHKAYPKVGESGTVSDADIQASFRAATNEAALTAVQLQKAVGVKNSASFKLFAEFAYHGRGGSSVGEDGKRVSHFNKFADALKRKDEADAMAWLRKTKAYELSQPERRQHYEKLTTEALRG